MAQDHFEKHLYLGGPDRVDWNYNLCFDGQPQIAEIAEEYAEILNHPGLHLPVPATCLHTTVARIGLVDERQEEEMLAFNERLKEPLADLPVSEVTVKVGAKCRYDGGNVMLDITPSKSIKKMRQLAMAQVGIYIADEDEFSPHITLAYAAACGEKGEEEIRERIAENPVSPVVVRLAELSLVKQWPVNDYYEREVIERLPLSRR